MPAEYSRTRRIGEMIQREIAILLQREIKDPRLQKVSLTAVEVSKDLSVAKVFYTVIDAAQGEELDKVVEDVERGLQKAASFIRYQLGQRIIIRNVPRLNFRYDDSVIKGAEMSQLIDEVIADDNRRMNHQDDGESSE